MCLLMQVKTAINSRSLSYSVLAGRNNKGNVWFKSIQVPALIIFGYSIAQLSVFSKPFKIRPTLLSIEVRRGFFDSLEWQLQ
jgi:hypothetical protein